MTVSRKCGLCGGRSNGSVHVSTDSCLRHLGKVVAEQARQIEDLRRDLETERNILSYHREHEHWTP